MNKFWIKRIVRNNKRRGRNKESILKEIIKKILFVISTQDFNELKSSIE